MPYVPENTSFLKTDTVKPVPYPSASTSIGAESKSACADNSPENIVEERLRAAFESVYHAPRGTNFARRPKGSYLVERTEAKFQGFKLAVLSIAKEDISLYALTSAEPDAYDKARAE